MHNSLFVANSFSKVMFQLYLIFKYFFSRYVNHTTTCQYNVHFSELYLWKECHLTNEILYLGTTRGISIQSSTKNVLGDL